MKRQKRSREWFEDEALWRATFPFIFPEKRFSDTTEEIEKVLALTSPSGRSVLDLCCGPGRCSVVLAKLGYSVCGVDRTRFLLDKALAHARAARVSVEWLQSDMRDFIRPDTFDLALSMFTSFGYFADRTQDTLVLSNIFQSLRHGGSLLIEMMGKEIIAKNFQASHADKLPDGSMLVEQRHVLDGWSRIRTDWTLVRNGRARQFTFQINLYSGRELLERMQVVGFTDVKLFGNFEGAPYDAAARRLIAIGKKP